MNVKIDKDTFTSIRSTFKIASTHVIGSQLYKTSTLASDLDILIIFEHPLNPDDAIMQYTDIDTNNQYLLCSETKFWNDLYSGDSTINADVILASNRTYPEKLKILRKYKIIKAYLGFAKRDIKNIKDKNKVFHVLRSLYCAEGLLYGCVPDMTYFTELKTLSDNFQYTDAEILKLKNEQNRLRTVLKNTKTLNIYN